MDPFVSELSARGLLAPGAARRIEELETRASVPLGRELNALLYLGALLILIGVGAAVKDRLEQLGPATILASLALSAAACFAYCVRKAVPFAPGRAQSPAAAFDYVLYIACGLVGVFFSYLEWKWRVLGAWWDLYLFGSGLLFAALAYRFDNRLVLATGILNLGAWLGLRVGRWDPALAAAKPALVAYGAALVALAAASRRGGIKAHFEDVYLRLGVHIALATLLSDASSFARIQFWVLMAACAALGAWSLRDRRFDAFAAAIGYAYLAALFSFLRLIRGGGSFTLWVILLSSAAVLAVLLRARSRFKETLA